MPSSFRSEWPGRRRGGRADVAVRGLVDDEISPEARDVVLVVSSAAPLKRHAELVLGIDREGRVGVGVAGVPDLLLGNESEVVIDVYGDPLHLWLREAVADGSGPGEIELVGASLVRCRDGSSQAEDGVVGEIGEFGEPILTALGNGCHEVRGTGLRPRSDGRTTDNRGQCGGGYFKRKVTYRSPWYYIYSDCKCVSRDFGSYSVAWWTFLRPAGFYRHFERFDWTR